MTPIPEPRIKPVYSDPRERVNVSHVIEAGALVLLGHPLLFVERGGGRSNYVFGREAEHDLNRLRRTTDEVLAHRERSFANRSTRNGDPHHDQQPR